MSSDFRPIPDKSVGLSFGGFQHDAAGLFTRGAHEDRILGSNEVIDFPEELLHQLYPCLRVFFEGVAEDNRWLTLVVS